MPTNFPGSLDTTTQLPTTRADGTTMATNHAADHDNANAAVVAVETKVGTGSTTSTAGQYLRGTGAGTSAWQHFAYANKTTTYTITTADDVISADATSAAFTVTLPSAATAGAGRQFTVKRTNAGTNNVTVGTTSSQTIDGATTYLLDQQYSSITVVSDGTNWMVI